MGLGKGVRSPRAASAPCPAPTATRGSRPRSESSWPFLPLADSPFSSQSGPFQGGQSPHTPILHRGNQQNRRGEKKPGKAKQNICIHTHLYTCIPGATDNRGVTPCPERREDKEGNAECTCACSPLRVCRRGCSILPVKLWERSSFGTSAERCRLLSPAPASSPRERRELQGCRAEEALPSHPPPTALPSPDSRGDGAPALARTSPCSAGAAAPPSPGGGGCFGSSTVVPSQ